MNIFLSWSGEASHRVAVALHQWLPYMIHSIRPFISSADISTGENWSDALSEEIKNAQHGVICVTPYNVYKPWMNFEAGALTRVIDRASVTPFLFRIRQSSLTGPLAQFQSADSSRDGVFGLIRSINGRLDGVIDPEVLQRNFDYWWTFLEADLKQIPPTSAGETRAFYPWLRTFEDLAIHDVSPDCSMVWFITADVFKCAGATEKILVNLQRVKYRYLIPQPDGADELLAKKELDSLMQRAAPGQLEYRCVPRDLFEQRAPSDYIMFESNAHGALRKNVFVKLPITGSATEYWFESDERAANGFYYRFSQLWDEMVPAHAPRPGESTSMISSTPATT
jgi:TIR domain